jgi:WD40 repeat protein
MSAPELVLQIGHGNDVYSVAFAPDGRTLAAGGGERAVRIWDARTGELWRLLAHGPPCRSLTYSPDGRLLAGAGEGEVVLWQLKTGKRVATLTGQCGLVNSLAFSPDGKLLACASEGRWFGHEVMWVKGGEVQLWEVATARCKQFLGKSRTEKRSVAWSPDGQVLAVASSDHVVRLWDVDTSQPRRSVLRHKEVQTVAFSPDGQLLATGGADAIMLWDLAKMKLRHNIRAEQVTSVAFAPDGQTLAVGTTASLALYATASGKRQAVLENVSSNCSVSSIAVSPDAKTVARGSNTFLKPARIQLWNVSTRKLQQRMPGHEACCINGLAYSPDGKNLFSCGGVFDEAGNVNLWDAQTGALKRTLAQSRYEIHSMTVSADGTMLAAGVMANWMLWETATAKGKTLKGLAVLPAFALSPDGRCAVAADDDEPVRILDTRTDKVLRTLRRHANVLAFSPDGRSLAVGAERGLSLWDLETGDIQWQSGKPSFDVPQLAFSSDGKLLAAVTIRWKGTKGKDEVRVWEPATGRLQQVIECDDLPSCLVFSPNGSILAIAADSYEDRQAFQEGRAVPTIWLWDTRRWRLWHRLPCSGDDVTCLAFSPDSKILAAAHADRTATVWDAKRGTVLHTLEDATGEMTCLAFSPDGKKLAAGNRDGWITLWQVATGMLLATLQVLPVDGRSRSAPEWIAFTPKGHYIASPNAAKFIRWRQSDQLLPARACAATFRQPNLIARALEVH